MSPGVTKRFYRNKEILVVDYSGCKEKSMIDVFEQAKAIVRKENKKVLVMSIFTSKNYVTE
jgi:hypothetical protein